MLAERVLPDAMAAPGKQTPRSPLCPAAKSTSLTAPTMKK
jgi:hypothetical protein